MWQAHTPSILQLGLWAEFMLVLATIERIVGGFRQYFLDMDLKLDVCKKAPRV